MRKVGIVTQSQVREIAETKMPDLNTVDIEAAMRMIMGTARSMGIEIEGVTIEVGAELPEYEEEEEEEEGQEEGLPFEV